MTDLYDPKIENTLVSTLAMHSEALRQIAPDLNPDYLYDARCRAIIAGLLDLYQHHKTITPILLADTLLSLNLLDQAGGTDHIHYIFNNGAEQANAAQNLLTIVKDHWLRRQEIKLARQIENNAADRTQESLHRLGFIKDHLLPLETNTIVSKGYDTAAQFDFYMSLYEQRQQNRDKPQLKLPWAKLQVLVPDLPPGCLIGILGNPGAGKTALLECISDKWQKEGFTGLYYHLEDSLSYKLDRRMARWASLDLNNKTNGDYQAIFGAWKMIDSWPGNTIFVHSPGWTMRQILSHAIKIVSEQKIDYIALDYLNKVAWDDRGLGLNSAQMRGRDIEEYKEFLERFNLIGLMAGQFDKKSKGSKTRELSDLRDSGELDDKAQVGLIIERQKDSNGQWENYCYFNISKCNFGQTGSVLMRFIGNRYLFTDQPGGNDVI